MDGRDGLPAQIIKMYPKGRRLPLLTKFRPRPTIAVAVKANSYAPNLLPEPAADNTVAPHWAAPHSPPRLLPVALVRHDDLVEVAHGSAGLLYVGDQPAAD
ncbi:MAG: hypothetical protein ACKO4X_17375, partial [Alphaproteobacteria bacterium]